MNEERKKATFDHVIANLDKLILGIVIIGLIFTWNRGNSWENKYNELKAKTVSAEEYKKIESKLDEMRRRERELYPQLDAKLKELDSSRAELSKLRKLLKKYEELKDVNDEQIKKMDLNRVADTFTSMGYPAKVRISNDNR